MKTGKLENASFPESLEITFNHKGEKIALSYEAIGWDTGSEVEGLRYGDNPDQSAVLYKPVLGNFQIAQGVALENSGELIGTAELIKAGKHLGKNNLADVDAALGIMRHLVSKPCCAIIKHGNPCGVAQAHSLEEALSAAYDADSLAAFGGIVVLNRECTLQCAELLCNHFFELVAAPSFCEKAINHLSHKKNLRVLCIPAMSRLADWSLKPVLQLSTLIDGAIIAQTSFVNKISSRENLKPALALHDGREYAVTREPTESEVCDMLFGWHICAGMTSNAIALVKNGVTLGLCSGQQDRVGAVRIAREKAFASTASNYARLAFGVELSTCTNSKTKQEVLAATQASHTQLTGAVMVSDGFFPFRDGVDMVLGEGISAILQPGGSLRDYESILACNEAGAAMKFTHQRCFKH